MKNIISRIMILAMLASFAACSSELDNAGGYAGDEAMVRMNFTGLNGFAVTRAVDQTAVEKVTVYLFEGTEESSELKYTLPVTLSDKTEAGLPGSFKVPEGGTYHVEAIANAETLTGISTYGDFLAQTTTAAFDGNLLMQGATAQDITLAGGQTTTLSMELVRLAATFQVEGAVEAGVSDVAFTLKGAVKKSYLVKHADGDSFTIPADAETGENAVPYSYENPENSTVMVITGTMNGAAYRTEVPVVQVLRNHLYTVKLVNNSGTIEPELTVTDWSEISSSLEIGVGSALMMTAATDKAQEPEATVVYPEEGELKSTQTVNVAADAVATYYLYVKSANIEAALTHTTLPDGWTLEAPVETRTDYLWEKGYWTLTIPANTTAEVRTLTVTATNKLVADATVSIMFVQEGKEDEAVDHSKNPLARWAEANSINALQKQYGSTETWWNWKYEYSSQDYPESTWANGVGSYYQWGRNAGSPFPTQYQPADGSQINTGGINWTKVTYDLPTKVTVAKTTNQNLFIINGDGNDYVSDGSTDEIWTDRTSKLYDDNGLTSYDNLRPWPCPEGYRLPTVAEYQQIIPKVENQSKSFTTLTELKELDGIKYVIRWTYSDDNPSITYGYQVWNEHLTIDCLVVPSTYTEDDLESVDWNDNNVVTRIFYTGGSRLGAYYGSHLNPVSPAPVTFDWDNTAYYWTSESAPKAGTAWAMTFRTSRRTDDQTGNYGPWFQIAAYPKDNAMLVRGIKDNQ